MSTQGHSTRSWETWVLVLALSLPYACLVLSLDFHLHICKVRGLDLIILKFGASPTSSVGGELQGSDKPFPLPYAEGQLPGVTGFWARLTYTLLINFSSIKWE